MSINNIIKNVYLDMELVLPMYNAHHYLSLKNQAKKYTLYTAKYGSSPTLHSVPSFLSQTLS